MPPQFGLGELAGYHIAGEQLGTYPDRELPALGRRRRPHVQLRPGCLHDSLAAWRICCRHCQRRNPLLPAASHQHLRSGCLYSQGEAHPSTSPVTCPTCKTAWPAQWNMERLAVCVPTSTPCLSSARPEPARIREPASAGLPLIPTRPKVVSSRSSFSKAGAPPSAPARRSWTGAFYRKLWDPQLLCQQEPADCRRHDSLGFGPYAACQLSTTFHLFL